MVERMQNLVLRKIVAQSHDKEKSFLLVLIMQGSLLVSRNGRRKIDSS